MGPTFFIKLQGHRFLCQIAIKMSKYYSFLFSSHRGPVTVRSPLVHDPSWQGTTLTSYSGPCLPLLPAFDSPTASCSLLPEYALCFCFTSGLDFTFCSSFLECLTPAGEHLLVFLDQLKCHLPFDLRSPVSASFESRVYLLYWIVVIPRSAALTRSKVPWRRWLSCSYLYPLFLEPHPLP